MRVSDRHREASVRSVDMIVVLILIVLCAVAAVGAAVVTGGDRRSPTPPVWDYDTRRPIL
jgi:hypothetical protein